MDNTTLPVSPKHALHTYIKRCFDRSYLHAAELQPQDDILMYLGTFSGAQPQLLIEDPVLEPTDKIVWQLLKYRSVSGSATAFPSYQQLCLKANIPSTTRIDHAITVLRCARWLTRCAGDMENDIVNHVILLHDEPLALADTLTLDPQYMGFLQQSTAHVHPRIREVSEALLASIEDDIWQEADVKQTSHPLLRGLDAFENLRVGSGRFYSFTAVQLQELRRKLEFAYRNETLPSVATPGGDNDVDTTHHDADPALIFPARLTKNHQALARVYLNTLPCQFRQAVLDEVEGRLRAEHLGAPPLADPLHFLKQLCEAVHTGDFVPVLGQMIQDARRWKSPSQTVNQSDTEPALVAATS